MISVFQKLRPFVSAQADFIKSSFEGLNFEDITPFRSLKDEYGTISGLLSFVQTSLETASHRYPFSSNLHKIIHVPSKFKPSKLYNVFSPWYQTWIVCYLILEEIQLWNDVSMGYFSPKCGHRVELCLLPRNSMKPCSSFEGKTLHICWHCYWIQQLSRGFGNWLKLEINPSFEAGTKSALTGQFWYRLECWKCSYMCWYKQP